MPNLRKTEVIKKLLLVNSQQTQNKKILKDAKLFDESILTMQQEALDVWRKIEKAYQRAEKRALIPYSLMETPKLYAIDPLIIAGPLLRSKDELLIVARLFTYFYLIVHFFDDHVEHRDKFYSKFLFAEGGNVDTQQGAAPFSFVLLSQQLIHRTLNELAISLKEKEKIETAINKKLLLQTRYFASERNKALQPEEVLEIKQRQVSGASLSILADILSPLLGFSHTQKSVFEESLIFLGSLTQITDDIRDSAIDATLRNANIVNVCLRKFGFEEGSRHLAEIYHNEEKRAYTLLQNFYLTEYLSKILSIPFYPFFVDKGSLHDRVSAR